MERSRLDELLLALAHPMRIDVVRLLACERAGLSAGEIARTLGVASSSLSGHLKALAAAGLVEPRRRWRSIYYLADARTLSELRDRFGAELVPPPTDT